MENTTDSIKFFVAVDYIELAEQKLAKLQKKYARKGYDLISRIRREEGTDKVMAKTNKGRRMVEVHGTHYTIDIALPEIKAGDYKFIGILKEEEGLVNIFTMDEDYDLTGYEKEDFRCDHCNTNRYRKTVFLFVNDNDEELMIAKTCVKEYFGINTEGLIKNIEYVIRELQNDFSDESDWFKEEGFGGGFGGGNYIDKEMFTSIAYGAMKTTGIFKGRGEDGYGTADMVYRLYDICNLLSESEKRELYEEREALLAVANRHDFNFKKVFDYWMEKENNSPFINNTQNALKMFGGSIGLVTWAVYDYMKEVEGLGKVEKAKKVNEYYGNVGDKFENINATITRTYDIPGFAYNTTTRITTLLTEDGHTFIWYFGNWNADICPAVDMKVVIKGKVKKHTEYKDWKQTVVSYVKITELINKEEFSV